MENVGPGSTAPGALPPGASLRSISRFNLLLKRLLLVGALAFPVIFLSVTAVTQDPAPPEVKLTIDPAANHREARFRSHHSSDEEEIPLLFLALMGLAALTLSQTRPSSPRPPQTGPNCAGKNVAPGQELPETAAVPGGIATR